MLSIMVAGEQTFMELQVVLTVYGITYFILIDSENFLD